SSLHPAAEKHVVQEAGARGEPREKVDPSNHLQGVPHSRTALAELVILLNGAGIMRPGWAGCQQKSAGGQSDVLSGAANSWRETCYSAITYVGPTGAQQYVARRMACGAFPPFTSCAARTPRVVSIC